MGKTEVPSVYHKVRRFCFFRVFHSNTVKKNKKKNKWLGSKLRAETLNYSPSPHPEGTPCHPSPFLGSAGWFCRIHPLNLVTGKTSTITIDQKKTLRATVILTRTSPRWLFRLQIGMRMLRSCKTLLLLKHWPQISLDFFFLYANLADCESHEFFPGITSLLLCNWCV